MPPSFARARRRPWEQNASTAEETRCRHSIFSGYSFLVFSRLWSSSQSAVPCVLYDFANAPVYVFHTDFANTKSKIPVRTLVPATSAAMAVQGVSATASFLIVIHLHLSTPL